jgi:hypothetical protein
VLRGLPFRLTYCWATLSALGRPNFTTQSLPPKNVFARTCVAPLAVPTIRPAGRVTDKRLAARALLTRSVSESIALVAGAAPKTSPSRRRTWSRPCTVVNCSKSATALACYAKNARALCGCQFHFSQKFSPAVVWFHSNQTVRPSNTPVSSMSGILRRTSTTKSSSWS